ncbi:hypothetical protein [Hyphococcus sp.]|jgi:hypothetical protein|uniref:hypothetical protein n=1 Tax=Hyphococcus sp. TaxID=2038636 RepID=UPI003D0F0F3D
MIVKTLAAAMAAAVMAASALAQEEASAIPVMNVSDDGLSGPGAALLLDRLQDAQFILVGEDHGFAGSPQITAALARQARQYGVIHHVVEIGPYSADWASGVLKRDGVDGVAAALEGRPLAMPFLNMREDAELALSVLDSGGDLWGVDQEFIGSPLLHLQTLHDRARGEHAKTRLQELLATETEAFATGNQGAFFMFTATEDVFAELQSYFPRDKTSLELIAAMQESAGIYQSYARGENFVSNTDRIDLIKRQFLQHYGSARGGAPRAIFKMGAIHAGRGTTFLNTFDIGSLVEGIAAANGLQVMRIAVYPLAGKQTRVMPSPEGAFATVEYASEEVAALIALAGLANENVPEDGWAVIALDPLRRKLGQKGMKELSPELKFMLLGYDFLVTTRGAHGATPLAN